MGEPTYDKYCYGYHYHYHTMTSEDVYGTQM